MQVDPIKPTLQPPGTERLRLKYDESLSNFAFKFNLRRYHKGNNKVSAAVYFEDERGRAWWILPATSSNTL